MRIVLYEMKKIWNWKIIVLLIIITTLFYQMFLYYPIEEFRNNHPHIEGHDLSVEMVERYGSNITEEQLSEFVTEKQSLSESEFNLIVESNPIFEEAGIKNYEDYYLLSQKNFENPEELTNEEHQALASFDDEQTDFIVYQFERIKDLAKGTSDVESNSILDEYTFNTTMTYIGQLAILIVLLSLILVSPLVVNDRTKNMHFLQYTSKKGRKTFDIQIIASLISTFVLTTLCVVIFGSLILRNDLLVFWNSNVNSFLNLSLGSLWFELSFGEYISIAILFIYIINLSVIIGAFIISRYSQNVITMIMKLIPVFAIIAIIFNVLFHEMFSPYNWFYHMTTIIGIEGIFSITLLVIAVALILFTLKREKHIDIY